MAEFNETVIDHIEGEKWCGVSTGEMALKNKLERFAEQFPDEVECIAKNSDGSVYYHVPWKRVHLYRPRVLSEATKERFRELANAMNESRANISVATLGTEENRSILRENAEVE